MARRKGKWYVEALDPDDTSNTIRTRVGGPFDNSKLAKDDIAGYADGLYEIVCVSPFLLMVSTEIKHIVKKVV